MKKVLILSVIAMLALGVFALAGSTAYSGLTSQVATLTVTSNIVVVQGFEATATSYDATFSGATGIPLTYTQPSYTQTNLGLGVLLAKLTVKSNMNQIGVAFSVNSSNSAINNLFIVNGLYFYANGSQIYNNGGGWYLNSMNWPNGWNPGFLTGSWWLSSQPNSPSVMSLSGSNSPYNGELDVLVPYGVVNQWAQAGKYPLTMTFLVFPKTSGF